MPVCSTRHSTMAQVKGKRKRKGPVPSIRNSDNKVTEPEVKVKRKCGRPRNPIPRHKRVSHINAEHRRRGKIQNGFQTLKNMVPKYESSGRDSKADILTKSVEYCTYLKKVCNAQEVQLKLLRAEQEKLSGQIERHQQNLPEGKLFDDQPLTDKQRFSNLVANRTEENWKYFIFSYLMKPLHESFQQTTDCSSKESFMNSTFEWANKNLSQAKLRPLATEALRNLSTETSFIDKPDLMPSEALQRCQKASKPSSSSTSSSSSGSTKGHHRQSNHKQSHSSHKHTGSHKTYVSHVKPHSIHKQPSRNSPSSKRSSSEEVLHRDVSPAAAKKLKGRQATAQLSNMFYDTVQELPIKTEVLPVLYEAVPADAPIKTEALPSCLLQSSTMNLPVKMHGNNKKMETVDGRPAKLSLSSMDSLTSYDSATELSPPGSSHGSSVFGDFTGYESPFDQCYDSTNIPLNCSPVCEDFLEHKHSSSMVPHHAQSVFADLENLDLPSYVESIYGSNSSPGLAYPQALPQPLHQSEHCYDSVSNLSSDTCPFLDQVDTNYLFDNVDQHLLNECNGDNIDQHILNECNNENIDQHLSNEPNDLMGLSARAFLADDSQLSFEQLLGDYDFNISDPNLLPL